MVSYELILLQYSITIIQKGGVLNVIVKLIAQQSSRLRRDGSRASTSHWARPVRKLKTMPFNFKIYKEIRKLFSRKELSLIF